MTLYVPGQNAILNVQKFDNLIGKRYACNAGIEISYLYSSVILATHDTMLVPAS